MKPIIVVHGIGGGDSETKRGFSNALKAAVLSGVPTNLASDLWREAAWEGVNDQLDGQIKTIMEQLIPDAKSAQRGDFPKTRCGALQYLGKCFVNSITNLMRSRVPTLFDYLLDFPLYLGEPRGSVIRAKVEEVLRANPHSVLVGHSLGSLICYDILCEANRSGNPTTVDALVTMGSPIGWAKTVDDARFIAVKPQPINIKWINMYYPNDPVCLSKPLDVNRFAGVYNVQLHPSASVGLLAHTTYWKDEKVAKTIRELAEI